LIEPSKGLKLVVGEVVAEEVVVEAMVVEDQKDHQQHHRFNQMP
jgi:hypothetical protein